MDVPHAAHPTEETLRDYGLGKLDDASAEAVSRHLDDCPDCLGRAAGLSFGSFLAHVRQAHLPDGTAPGQPTTAGSTLSERTAADAAPAPANRLAEELANHPDYKYDIVRELGGGGMGVVYLAHNRMMGRDEVLKVIGWHIAGSPGVLDRFLREIRAVAGLRHPNIVKAYSAFRSGERLIFCMEYVEGLDLARMVKAQGPMSINHACYFVYQAALGLQHAHEKGMVHRDIKPGNLMLSQKGDRAVVKVLDFGLTKASRENKVFDSGLAHENSEHDEAGDLTVEGQMLGTPDFIAPEQILDAQKADIRADIYSLGCTLYYLLSGRPPFQATTLYEVLRAHHSMEARLLNFVRDEVPAELAALVAKMMAKDPDRRFQTPAEVAEALEPFFRSKAVASSTSRVRDTDPIKIDKVEVDGDAPSTGPMPVRKHSRWGRPRMLHALALALLAEATGTIGFVIHRIRTETEVQLAKVDAWPPGAVVELRERMGQTWRVDSKPLPSSDPLASPGTEQVGEIRRFEEHEQGIIQVDSKPLPSSDPLAGPGSEQVGEIRRFEGHEKGIIQVALSRDGRLALSGSADHTARLWDVATGKELKKFEGHTNQVYAVAFRPAGQQALTGSEDNLMKIWDVASGKELRSFEGHTNIVTGVSFSPDGKWALSSSWDQTLRLWDVEAGQELRKFEGHTEGVQSVAFSPDGQRAVSGGFDRMVRLWDVQTGQELRKFEGHTAMVRSVAYSPDGRRVLSGAWEGDGTLRLWDVASGLEDRKMVGIPEGTHGVAISPDGRRALAAGATGDVQLWDLETGRQLCRLVGHAGGVQGIAFSPDGRYGLSGGSDRTLRLWALPDPLLPPPAIDHKVGEVYHLEWQDEQQGFPAHTWWSRFTPDGNAFLVGGDGGPKGDIRLWDVASGKLLQQFVTGGEPWFSGGLLLPGGKQLLSWYSRESSLYLWNVATGQIIRKFEGPAAEPVSVAVSPEGKHFLAGGNDNVIHLYDIDTGKELARLAGHDDKCSGVFSPDGKRVLTYGPDKTLRLWDVDGGKLLHKLEGHTDACSGVFAPDGKQVLSFSADKTLRLWDSATGKQVRLFEGPTDEVAFATFLPGGEKIVAWGKDRTVRVWEAATGNALNQFDLGERIGDWPNVALTPDGRRLLTADDNGTVYVLDLKTGKEIHRFENAVKARGFSFSPDGRYAAAGSFRAGVYLWRLPR
jgi:WD40 repeat protein/serine/threonine protein kinase